MGKEQKVSDDYLKTLEKVKEQYEQYLYVGEAYELNFGREELTDPQPPSPDRPLTTNTFSTE